MLYRGGAKDRGEKRDQEFFNEASACSARLCGELAALSHWYFAVL
jgi:hypothetical protein